MYRWLEWLTPGDAAMSRAARLLGWLPKSASLLLCGLLGWLLYTCAGQVRRQVQHNMAELLGTPSEPAPARMLDRLSRRYFRNVVLALYEICMASRWLRVQEAVPMDMDMDGERYLHKALEQGKGAIVFTPHVGNFFYYYWYLSRRYDCLTVATAYHNELTPLYMTFKELGCKGLDYDSTPPLELLRQLRSHLQNNGVVFILGDFYRDSFPSSRLFGRHTRSPGGTAMLALELGSPIIPFYGCRVQGFRHRLTCLAPIYLHEEFDRRRRSEATQRLNEKLEELIREVPEQWFYWFNAHERWTEAAPAAGEPGDTLRGRGGSGGARRVDETGTDRSAG